MAKKNTQVAEVLNKAEPEPEKDQVSILDNFNAEKSKQLNPNSILWTEHVLSLLREDELIDGHPTCDGLRRIFEELGYKILSGLATPCVGLDGHAVVQFTIDYIKPEDDRVYSVSEVSSCSENNTEPPYNLYPYSTAATMAEGRALRKALRLKTIVREEMGKNAPAVEKITIPTTNKITEAQKIAIEKFSTRLKINVLKLINHTLNKPIQLNDLTVDEAGTIMKALNLYERGPANKCPAIPDEIKLNS